MTFKKPEPKIRSFTCPHCGILAKQNWSDLMTLSSDVNYLAVLVCAIVAMGIGSFWYSPFLLGKMWLDSMEKSEEILNSQNKLTRELLELPHILNVRLPGNDELMYENRPIRERMEEVLQNAPLSEETKLWLKDGVITYIESLTIQDDFSDNVQRREFEKTFENKNFNINAFRNYVFICNSKCRCFRNNSWKNHN